MKTLIRPVALLSTLSCLTLLPACGAATESPVDAGLAAGPNEYKADFKTSALFFTQMSKSVDNSGLDANKYVHKLQRTWYSSNVKGALAGDNLNLPNGTTAIKETTDAAGATGGHFVMVKMAKDTWHYEVRKPDGTLNSGAPMGDNVADCHGCHTAFKTKDYLAGTAIVN